MEIKITTQTFLKVLEVLSWIIFIGLCIEAGGILFNTFYTLAVNPEGTKNFWMKADLSNLYQFDRMHYFSTTVIMCIVTVLKAIMFYLIVKALHDKKIDLAKPFNESVKKLIQNCSYLALGIGLFSWKGANYTAWFVSKGIAMPDIQSIRLGGADVWLLMGVILLVIAQIFKRGVEIQSENELTI